MSPTDESTTTTDLTLNPLSLNYYEELQKYFKSIKPNFDDCVAPINPKTTLSNEKHVSAVSSFASVIETKIQEKEKHIETIKAQKQLYYQSLETVIGFLMDLLRITTNAISNLGIWAANGFLKMILNSGKRFEYYSDPPDFDKMIDDIHTKYDENINLRIVSAINEHLGYYKSKAVTKEELLGEKGFSAIKNQFKLHDTQRDDRFQRLFDLLKSNQPHLTLEEKISLEARKLGIDSLKNFDVGAIDFKSLESVKNTAPGNTLKTYLENEEFCGVAVNFEIKMLRCFFNCGNFFNIQHDSELSLDGKTIDPTLDKIAKEIILAQQDEAKINIALGQLTSYCLDKEIDKGKFHQILSRILINSNPNWKIDTFQSKLSNLKNSYHQQFVDCLKIQDWSVCSSKITPPQDPTAQARETLKAQQSQEPNTPDYLNPITNLIMSQENFSNLDAIKFRISQTLNEEQRKEPLKCLDRFIAFCKKYSSIKFEVLPKISCHNKSTQKEAQAYYDIVFGIMEGNTKKIQENLSKINQSSQFYRAIITNHPKLNLTKSDGPRQ